MKSTIAIFVAVFSGLAGGFSVPPARAGDEVGPNASCQELWVARNQLYKNAGYCFKTARAREYFGNGGCLHNDIEGVPLSEADHHDINQIKKLEAKKGC